MKIARRRVLRGVLGGIGVRVGLPALDLMLDGRGTAFAQGVVLPRRLVVFFWGNGRGVEPARWTPTGVGASWTPSPQLDPLAKVKDYVNVVSGFDSKLTKSPRGHHKGCVAMLSGADYLAQAPNGAPYRSTFAVPSIDQVAARELGRTTPFRSLELGISSRVIRGEGTTLAAVSHNGPDAPNNAEVSPVRVYNRLLGGTSAAPSSPGSDNLAQVMTEMRKSALDVVLDDLVQLRGRVGTRDRARLDQHADSLRDIEKRLVATGQQTGAACPRTSAPTDPVADGSREPLEERTQLMSRLMATAFACDLTRVSTVLFIGSVGSTLVWQTGATRGHHDLSHGGASTQSVIDAATIFVMKQYATLIETLKSTPEGAGNLLDSCALMATSDCSDGAAHSVRDMPIVLAGRAGGALRYPGVHQRGAADNNTSRVLLTLLRAVGLNLTEFGKDGGRATTGVSEVEA
jgi:hypothetical protein